ncbi:MAG: hypothetical protein ACO36I_09065 [Candidatus Latescibacterota bacterium]|jgi:hypothetical protein
MSEPQMRQKLLYLYLGNSNLEAAVIGWSLYDGTTKENFEAAGEAQEPPYKSVLDAMRDGWRVIQSPTLKAPQVGREYQVDYLDFEFVLEKMEAING